MGEEEEVSVLKTTVTVSWNRLSRQLVSVRSSLFVSVLIEVAWLLEVEEVC